MRTLRAWSSHDNGQEDLPNMLGAPYKVIHPLNLTPGSKDLEMVLHTSSFGPFEGTVRVLESNRHN